MPLLGTAGTLVGQPNRLSPFRLRVHSPRHGQDFRLASALRQ
jgi:hypothetical protein